MALKQRVRETAAAVGGDARIEQELDAVGLKWEFIPGVYASAFDKDRSLRNQARVGASINQKRVETYAEAMKKGDKFPPVVASGRPGKYLMADGNHRLVASELAKKPMDMYLVTGPAETITLYMYRANTKHGLPTSEEERVQHALYLIDSGVNVLEAATQLTVPVALVRKASSKRTTEQRFSECSIPLATVETLPESAKWRLAQISTDEGFVAAVELTKKAGLNLDEVFQLVTELNDIKSSPKQVEWVKSRYDMYADKIAGTGGGAFARRGLTPKGRLKGAVTTVLHLPDDINKTAKLWAGVERDEAAKEMRAAARRLNELARALSA